MIKKTLKHQGPLGLGMGAFFAASDFKTRVQNKQDPATAAIASFSMNILPAILFNGPGGMLYQTLWSLAPQIPMLTSAVIQNRQQHSAYLRNSALPFSYNGFQPSASAMQSMQRGMDNLGQAKGLSATHSALAAQALRR